MPFRILFFCLASFLHAETPSAWTPAFSLQVQTVDDVTPSPDGKYILWTQKRAVMEGDKSEFVGHIFLGKADGSQRIQLTRGDKSAGNPEFSRDGKFIYFASDRSGKRNLYRIPIDGGEAEVLTDWKGALGSFRISPDGKWAAFTGAEEDKDEEKKKKEKADYKVVNADPKNQGLWLAPLEGDMPGKPRKLVDPSKHIGSFDWSPDSKSIAIEQHPTSFADDSRKADLSEVDVASGKIRVLVNTPQPETRPLFSPDGRYLAFLRGQSDSMVLGERMVLLTRATGELRELPKTFDENPNMVAWTADSKRILYQEGKGTRVGLYSMPLDAQPEKLVVPSKGTMGPARLNVTGTMLGMSMQNTVYPVEAYATPLTSTGAGKTVRVSAANTGLKMPPLGATNVIRWKAKDGMEIEGLLTYPVNYKVGTRVPLILNIHGGPAGAFNESFLGAYGGYPLAAFAAKGYAILRPNPRGSSAYGNDFRRRVVKDWGGMDFQDLMAGVDYVIAQGIADPEKLAVMGWSYGGYMTAWTVTQTTRFKAAAIGAGITNTVSMYGTEDIPTAFHDYFGGPPWDEPEVYRKTSPLQFITNAKTPTLLQHGENDVRVPVSQAYEFHRALERVGVPTKMVVYPRTGHTPAEPKFILHVMEEHLAWVEKYLGGS